MAEHNECGTKGEKLATVYLKEKGYTILETNWRHRNLEADIIAVHSGVMIIAEVKTRSSNYFGDPETFVTKQKQSNLRKAANGYIQQKQLDLEVRFDIISVILDKISDQATVNHIENAFLFGN
ncbi:MAG TPA: YraN family protein [Bacteroidia bacterium]|jgi:putative endonuclease|nr:YraN family protein [Bacteroidia bacterium]HRG52562.1 YraN family protein [Bacteroidia bacterium]